MNPTSTCPLFRGNSTRKFSLRGQRAFSNRQSRSCLWAARQEKSLLYGTCKIAHSGPGRSQRENVSRVLFADDRPSGAGVQRSLRENPAAASAITFREAAGLYLHLLSLGRDGRGHSQSGFQKGPEL